MSRLSISYAEWRNELLGRADAAPLQAVVIGSGYGGSVAALRLAEMGYKVIVLERGSEFQPGDFPNDISQLPKFLRLPSADGQQVTGRASGLFELRLGPGVVSLVGNGLGGGSLINAGVVMRPDPDVFAQEQWPAAIRLPAGDSMKPDHDLPGLENWFECAEAQLNAYKWPTEQSKTAAFDQLAKAIRFPTKKMCAARATPVFVTIDPVKCTQCGDCATGCNVPDAKLTLRDTYLAQAAGQAATLVVGASVWTLAPVRQATSTPEDGHAPAVSWRLRVLETASVARWPCWEDAAHAEGFDIEADLVVLAAGTFGSTELLQRSKDRCGQRWWMSPEVGSHFSGNGDSLGFIVDDKQPVDAIGAGANSCLPSYAGRNKVGPTITQQINLRELDDASPIPLRSRLTIEDGAVPGAIARVFAEMLATGLTAARLEHWRTGPPGPGWKRFFEALDPARRGHDPLAAGNELARRSQVVLTMGHDESSGRIVWVPGRDASVPYWEHPEDLETYRIQEEIFQDTTRRMAAEWIPNPAWRLLPKAASQAMSGPAPSTSITTVHPLGGCIMGADPLRSVVDDVGRLWRSDHRDDPASAADWARHENFLILDGSIVPTSLGVNPLLTITALAERAMGALRERRRRTGVLAKNTVSTAAPPPATTDVSAWTRSRAERWQVTMHERLVCEALRLSGDLQCAFGASVAGGELNLKLAVDNWLEMWELNNHPIDKVSGTLRLQVGPVDAPMVATYRVCETYRCEMLRVSVYGPKWWWWRIRWVWKIGPWLRVMFTWIILRFPDVWAGRNKPGQPETLMETLTRRLLPGLRQFGHSTERRKMKYHLRLELDSGDEVSRDLDKKWTQRWLNNLPYPDKLPLNIELKGKKRVEYAATWCELGRYLTHRLRLRLRGAAANTQFLPQLRESFFDQVSHLSVTVPGKDRGDNRLKGRFLMDFSALLRDPPLRLGPVGDLTGGIMALSAYPGVFLRFILKTRLPDFRLPNYSQIPLPDMATTDERRLRPTPAVAPEVQRHVLRVPRGTSSSDSADVNPNAEFELVLWRYVRPVSENSLPTATPGSWYGKRVQRLKSILLVHAYAQSGYTYTINTLPVNLAGLLYQRGYEVWVLEHRLSTRLAIHEEPTTLDQIARFDLPIAVDHILDTLKNEFAEKKPAAPLDVPQLHVFAQCLGSAALAMSLLSGRLHYADAAREYDEPPTPHCPKLASAIFSQTHALCIGQPGTQARTWIPALLRDAFGRTTIPLGVHGPVDSLAEAWMDRVFSALPIPDDEQCPSVHGASEDDCATCRRVRFIEAPLFKHRNLSAETHRQLPLHFGKANVRTFAQAAKCIEAERLVDEDGQSIYVNEENVRKFAALPVAFLHGAENELFHPESARRTAALFARLHPDWATLAAKALGKGEKTTAPDRAAWVVAGHGHYDVLIGNEAPALVYPGIATFFDTIQKDETQDNFGLADLQMRAVLHFPRVGPMIGPLRAREGRIQVRVSFLIDDRFSDGKQGPNGSLGTRSWAYVRVRSGTHTSVHRLHVVRRIASTRRLASVFPYRMTIPSFNSPSLYPYTIEADDATAYRFAVGKIVLDAKEWEAGTPLDIEAFSVHESLEVEPGTHNVSLHTDLQPNAFSLLSAAQDKRSEGTINDWIEQLLLKSLSHLENLARSRLPIPDTASRIRLETERDDFRFARVSAAARAAVLLDTDTNAAETISFLAGTCRYPGFPFDRARAEHAVQRVLPRLADTNPLHHPAFALFVGDQIYADASAGIVDPLSPNERFAERHRSAMSRSADVEHPALGDLLANLPTVMTPDDHEYIDNYPVGPPLVRARPSLVGAIQDVAQHAAIDAWRFFQSSSGGVGRRGWVNFEAGPLRILVLDSRSHRGRGKSTIFTHAQRSQVESWLQCKGAQQRLNLIVTGSVILPGLRALADPANPGPPDTFQCAPEDRLWLLTKLADACDAHPKSFRFAILSGDYHVSLVSHLALDNRNVGLSIVVPPVYAPMPYTNALLHSIDFSERLTIPMPQGASAPCGASRTWSIAPLNSGVATPVWSGSAIAEIRVSRTANNPTSLYEIQLQADLVDYEQGEHPTLVTVSAKI